MRKNVKTINYGKLHDAKHFPKYDLPFDFGLLSCAHFDLDPKGYCYKPVYKNYFKLNMKPYKNSALPLLFGYVFSRLTGISGTSDTFPCALPT